MLKTFMTATATTTRRTNPSDGTFGAPSAHLAAVKITPVMLAGASGTHEIRRALGLEGTAVQLFEAYTEPHVHTDDSTSVNQLPDIAAGDRLTSDGTTYLVRWAESQPPTSTFARTLLLYLTEDKVR
jgi:hypothetical protein